MFKCDSCKKYVLTSNGKCKCGGKSRKVGYKFRFKFVR